MRLTFYVLLLATIQSLATDSYAQVTKLNLNLSNTTVKQVLSEIEDVSEFYFLYNSKIVDVERKVDVKFKNKKIDEALDLLFKNTQISYNIVDRQIVLSGNKSNKTNLLRVQEKSVTGTVSDDGGLPLPGVTVIIKGTTNGTVTNMDGNYSISNIPENATLVFSFVGMLTQEVGISNQTSINVTMAVDAIGIEEVVAVGYGVQKKINLTGSIASISSEKLAESPSADITQSLAGRLPGIFMLNSSGQPGQNDATTFNIRGFGDPLIIVDGIEWRNDQFAELNPNEIESMNVLKDAASAAVYGSRAGNGVILITTKRGINKKATFQVTQNFSLQSFTNNPDYVSSGEYAEMENIALYNEGKESKWSQDNIDLLYAGTDPAYPNTNWWDLTFAKFAPLSKTNLNVRGGNDKVKYFLSGGYLSQGGMLKSGDIDFNRYNIRSNIDIDINSNFKIGLDMNAYIHDYIGPSYDVERSENLGIMTFVLRSRPYYPSEFPDKTIIPYSGPGAGSPVAASQIENVGYRKNNNMFVDGKFHVEYKLPFNIKFNATLDYNRLYQREKLRRKSYDFYMYDWGTDVYTKKGSAVYKGKTDNNSNALYETYYLNTSLTQQYKLSWDKKIKKHSLSALAVLELVDASYESLTARRVNYSLDLDILSAGSINDLGNGGTMSESGRVGLISRVNYSYADKYLLELSCRYDGSPKFPESKRWGFFPSVSGGWRISEESFIKDNYTFIDNLKLRLSYGQLGNDNIGSFKYLATYSLGGKYYFGDNLLQGINSSSMPNTSITWETMTMKNIGADITLWEGLLSTSFDYFYRLREDVVGTRSASLSNVVGAGLPAVNYAKYDNRGFEFVVGHVNHISDFNYSINANMTWSRQKTVYVDESNYSNKEEERRNQKNGRWTKRYFGYKTDGLFQSEEEIRAWADIDGKSNATIQPGDIRVIDLNEDGKINILDKTTIGRSSFPELMFAFDTYFEYHGFDMKMLWQGAGQYDVNLKNVNDIFSPFYAGASSWRFWYEDAYTPENPWRESNTVNAIWPRYQTDTQNRNNASWTPGSVNDFFLKKADYIRLKNLEFGYNIPDNLLKKYKISKCRFYVSGSNLLTITKLPIVDPEFPQGGWASMGHYYPQTKLYNIGVSLTF